MRPERTVYERYAENAERAVVGCLVGVLVVLALALAFGVVVVLVAR